MSWWAVWILAGVVLLVIELLMGTFFLLWIACGAFVAGIVAIFTPAIWWISWLAFAVSSVILVLVTRPLAHSIHGRPAAPSNVDAMIGRTAVVIDTIDPVENVGRVRVGSDEWRARSDVHIPRGQTVKVLGVEGATLLVEAIENQAAQN